MRAGQAGTALGLGRLGRSSNCSSFIYHQGQGADRTYRAVLIGNHDLPLYRISHPPRVVPTPDTIPRYKPLTIEQIPYESFSSFRSRGGHCFPSLSAAPFASRMATITNRRPNSADYGRGTGRTAFTTTK